jgi:crotonobetainyl-CoA:carnitine CoA-transferase CaiB-like acyl-CoA transferase
MGVGTHPLSARLCDLLGTSDDALRGLYNPGRVGRRAAIGAAIGARTAERRRDDLLADLRAARIPAGPVLRPDEAITAARAWDPGAVLALDHATLGTLEALAPPLEGAGLRRDHTAPPALGEGGEELAARWLGDPEPTG